MNDVPASILEGREAIGPWNYSARIPEGASSRNYALIPLLVALLICGIGIFLSSDVARDVPFWSNASVWIGLIFSAMGVLLSVWMYFGRWVWTTPQMALFGIAGLGPVLWAFQGAPLASFFLYSKAPLLAKGGILLLFIAWHGYWIQQTAKRCLIVWRDASLRDKVWLPYDCATIYRRSAAKAAMDGVGTVWHPGPFGILLPVLLCIPLYIYRKEIVEYLDIPWVPMIGFVLGLSVFVAITTALTFGIIAMLVIPGRIVATTGKPVLIDMMTPADAPR